MGWFAAVIFLYGLINFYIGLRGWHAIGHCLPFLSKVSYWVVFWVISLSYLIARLLPGFVPGFVKNSVQLFGAYWLGAMYYFLIIIASIDLLLLVDRPLGLIKRLPYTGQLNGLAVGLFVIAAVAATVAYGTWNARNPRVVSYEVNIDKKAGSLKTLHIVMASDLHLNEITNNKKSLTRLVEGINQLDPDIVMLPGDVIDETAEPFIKNDMGTVLGGLKAKLGVYFSPGNHEYFGRQLDRISAELQKSGVNVLMDSSTRIGDEFYIIGRHDPASERMTETPRKSLEELMTGIDRKLPVILLDHQPVDLATAQREGVDLQLSGHTHRGQIFPNHFITRRVFEIDWGFLKKGSYNIIVSCGYGTWGPPMRIGNTPEIVDIRMHFKQ